MRISLRDLKAVRAGGVLTRYALLGESAYVVAELPASGTAGTTLEDPCRVEHWGYVLKGELTIERRSARVVAAGSAFHIAAGSTHRILSAGPAVVAGFIPVTEPVDDSPDALRKQGMGIVRSAGEVMSPPSAVDIVGTKTGVATTGQVQTLSAAMGEWLFTRSTFGPIGGFADGWCDLPHWGQILEGTLLLHWERGDIELLGAGDVFYCPGDVGGHRIEVADAATMIDYTPISAIREPGRRRAPRAISALQAVSGK